MGRAIDQEKQLDAMLIRIGLLESKVESLCATLNVIIEHTERAMAEDAKASAKEKKVKKSVKKDTNRTKDSAPSK